MSVVRRYKTARVKHCVAGHTPTDHMTKCLLFCVFPLYGATYICIFAFLSFPAYIAAQHTQVLWVLLPEERPEVAHLVSLRKPSLKAEGSTPPYHGVIQLKLCSHTRKITSESVGEKWVPGYPYKNYKTATASLPAMWCLLLAMSLFGRNGLESICFARCCRLLASHMAFLVPEQPVLSMMKSLLGLLKAQPFLSSFTYLLPLSRMAFTSPFDVTLEPESDGHCFFVHYGIL